MNELKRMLKLFRNMTAYIYAWLTLLLVIFGKVKHIEGFSPTLLLDVFIFSALSAAGFSISFTKVLIKKVGFIGRLNIAVVYFTCLEICCFYKTGLFASHGSLVQWIVFFGIIAALYSACLVIFGIYSRRNEALYTDLLDNYKIKREKSKDE